MKISIPKEIEPPQDIAPEEEKYVSELLAAYAEAIKSGNLDKAIRPRYLQNSKETSLINESIIIVHCVLTALFENL